jgi:GAF domain-containing protein
MFQPAALDTSSKLTFYADLASSLTGLLGDERDWVANAANTAALIYTSLPDLNWAGFYMLKEGELVLGPFQGLPACIRIAMGRGVCGTAASTLTTQLVTDVHAFPGHIACDAASQSELVVPLVKDSRLIGVLDLDSPSLARFDADDAAGIEKLAAIFVTASDY